MTNPTMTSPTMTNPTVTTLVVMAKAPRAGRSKTRLCPPCRPEQAAALAEAALRDTLAAVRVTPGVRPVVALDGPIGPWCPPGLEVIEQRGDGLDERLSAAVEQVGGPVLVIGMDTPQVTPALLSALVARIRPGRSVIGPAADGGWWALGLHRADGAVFRGVPMSESFTYARQVERLAGAGLAVDVGPELRDVDHWPDALAGAAAAPGTCFAAAVTAMRDEFTVGAR